MTLTRTLGLLALSFLSLQCADAVEPADSRPEAREAASALDALLAAADPYAELLAEVESTDASRAEEVFALVQRVERSMYPTREPAVLDARERLLSQGAAAVPTVLAALQSCKLGTARGYARAEFANALLAEMCGGHFGWHGRIDNENAVPQATEIVRSWQDLVSQTAGDADFWSGGRSAATEFPRRLPKTAPRDFLDLGTVLLPGQSLAIRTPDGTLTVRAGRGFLREYQWSNASRSAWLEPRVVAYGASLGIYGAGMGDHWEAVAGITRGVLNEGQMHFASEADALRWIESQRNWLPFAYRGDGLAAGWRTVPERRQLNVEVWQILVGDKRPIDLPGADDGSLALTR